MSGIPMEQDPSLGGAALDQASRASQAEPELATEEDVVETLRRQLREREDADAGRLVELERANAARMEAQRAREAAEQRAREAEQTSQRSQISTDAARLEAVTSSLGTLRGQMDSMEKQYETQMSEGEYGQAAKTQREMAMVGARLVQVEMGEAQLKERIEQAKTNPPAPAAQYQDERAGREAFIAGQAPAVQQWLRGPTGERFFNDPEFQADVRAAARLAQKQHPVGSAEYVEAIERQVGVRQAEPRTPPAAAEPADRGVPSAPAGRAAAGGSSRNSDPSRVYLTAEELSAAKISGVSPAEYAKAKAQLEREGHIGPNALRVR